MRTMHRCWQPGFVLGIMALGALGAFGVLGELGVIEARAASDYVDEDRRFIFMVPDDWALNPSSSTGALVSYVSGQPLGEFDLNVFDAGGETSLDLLVPVTERQFAKSFDNYTFIGATPMRLGDENAQQIDYTATVSDTLLSFSQILCVHEGSVYALTISAAPEDITRLAEQQLVVLQSWVFT